MDRPATATPATAREIILEIVRNMRRSEENIPALEAEARAMIGRGDDLGARAALYKMNLERLAIQSFTEQLAEQKNRVVETRRRLHLLELQLRQYEVGRSILLSQLGSDRVRIAVKSRNGPVPSRILRLEVA